MDQSERRPNKPFPKRMLATCGRRIARNGGSAECRSPKYAMLNSSAQGSSVPAVSPSGRGSAWLERLVRDQEVGGSNPLAPTTLSQRHTLFTQLQRVMALASAQVLGKKNTIKRAISRTLSTSWSTKFIYSHGKKTKANLAKNSTRSLFERL